MFAFGRLELETYSILLSLFHGNKSAVFGVHTAWGMLVLLQALNDMVHGLHGAVQHIPASPSVPLTLDGTHLPLACILLALKSKNVILCFYLLKAHSSIWHSFAGLLRLGLGLRWDGWMRHLLLLTP